MERRLGKEIHRLDVMISRYLKNPDDLRETGMEELSFQNILIIRFLTKHAGEDVYQRDLEKEFGITRSTASRVLLLMEQKGLIVRSGVAHDARLKKLTLTDKAVGLSNTMDQIGQSAERRLLKGFSADERDQLLSFIDRMTNNLRREDD